MNAGTLIITEKPSVAQECAKLLGIASRGDGYLVLKSGAKITWAVGHLLGYLEPDELNEAWKGYWNWSQLPMTPPEFKQKPVKRTAPQFKVVKELLKTASNVIIATDAGREGEMIAREILDYCKYRGSIQRLWPKSMLESDLRDAFANLLPGSVKEPLYQAAKARGSSDWLVGYNISRAATLAAKVRGDYFPVGRVQTPVLSLVCKREADILGFKSKTYFELEAQVKTQQGQMFKMMHSPAEADRIYDKSKAESLLKLCKNFSGPVSVEKISGRESPPLPFSLPSLQKEGDRRFGFSATETLKYAQELYDAKLITYPRSDYDHLASNTKARIPVILDSLSAYCPSVIASLRSKGVTLRDSTFDDSKIGDHDAIIPTGAQGEMSTKAAQLYRLIVQRFLQSIAPDLQYDQTKLAVNANGVLFKASGRITRVPGFSEIRLLESDPEE